MKEKLGYLVGGLLLGTAGKAILTSKDAKNLYTHCTAAVLRGKDAIMETAGAVRENCGDIHADALDINNSRYEEANRATYEEAKAYVAEYEAEEAEEADK